MTLERMRQEIHKGLDFDAARQKVKATTIFTTHTPVASGHDVFKADLMEKYFQKILGLNWDWTKSFLWNWADRISGVGTGST